MYCKNCGSRVSVSGNFCKNCGNKLSFNGKKKIFIISTFVLVILSVTITSIMGFGGKENSIVTREIALKSSTSSIVETSESSQMNRVSSSTSKLNETIQTENSKNDLYEEQAKTDKVMGTFKFLKSPTLPAGFLEMNKNNVLIEFQGYQDTTQKFADHVNIDITIKNISNNNLMVNSSKLFIHSNSTTDKIYSEVSTPWNIAIEPSCSIVIPKIFTSVPDQHLVGGWSLSYDTAMDSLVSVPAGSEGFIDTLKMASSGTSNINETESSESEFESRIATEIEAKELNDFFIENGGTEEQLSQVTWWIAPNHLKTGGFSAEAMHSTAGKTIMTVGYDPEIGYMTESEYVDMLK